MKLQNLKMLIELNNEYERLLREISTLIQIKSAMSSGTKFELHFFQENAPSNERCRFITDCYVEAVDDVINRKNEEFKMVLDKIEKL